MTCPSCGEEVCKHDGCYCDDRRCRRCADKREREADAEAEAAWQRDVIGPLCGFTEGK